MSKYSAQIKYQPKAGVVEAVERDVDAPSFDTAVGALTRLLPKWSHAVIITNNDTGEVRVFSVLQSSKGVVFFDRLG